jgi:hypothetical protein
MLSGRTIYVLGSLHVAAGGTEVAELRRPLGNRGRMGALVFWSVRSGHTANCGNLKQPLYCGFSLILL